MNKLSKRSTLWIGVLLLALLVAACGGGGGSPVGPGTDVPTPDNGNGNGGDHGNEQDPPIIDGECPEGIECVFIRTLVDLQEMGEPWEGGSIWERNKNLTRYYILANNIDASDASALPGGRFVPIGLGIDAFSGTFDGNGHTIRNLELVVSDIVEEDAGMAGVGLFAEIGEDGVVANLTLENVHVRVSD